MSEGIGPLPAAIVATHAPPMPYFEGAFQAVFPGTTLVKGAVPARLCRTTKTFKYYDDSDDAHDKLKLAEDPA